ncbi:UNVERIFIED_CONTAM: hypothetical protein Sradi_2545600 [Sesamum radiatum]|uniref:Uncharacterized protein n=1 Tax=Sesamum radiatum TaxID=300843 RepID=A0AAW2SN81_SESRA
MEWEDAGQGSIAIDVTRTLMGSASIPTTPTILKVDRQLWGGGDNVYDPEIISIGPFHHGKPKLTNMELYKFRYLRQLLQRSKVNQPDKYVIATVGMEKMARKCYAVGIDLNESDFVKMMLPFFVLSHMFDMSKNEDPNDDLTSLILLFAKGKFLNLLPPAGSLPIKSTDHMFGLLHDVLVHPSVEMIQPEIVWKKNEAAHWVWEY